MSLSRTTSMTAHTNVFLETGTFHGGGVTRALNAGYRKVISIEVFEPLFRENQERFAKQIERGEVELWLGDSARVIGEAVKNIDEPILFWFDAHDQTMNGAGVGDVKCPIIKELRNVMENRSLSRRRLDILMIDDMRLIEAPKVGWNIDLTELYRTIWEYNPDFRLTREAGHIAHDILRCEYKYLA